ncbi:MAG: hypothetical protein JETCAE03_18340 [Ignavibacteriaceae bacterium]|nr:MAG: hypothetical protein BroJett017_14380 [Ignavibacteriota bacterium]GJQ42336.1 MAG: hypothetical protein JETCAE03_18340 [Ignavibacteriaceae bacterium]
MITVSGCELFQVREPEDPDETKSSFRVPVEPADVIQNLINSFKDKNSNDYKKNLSSGLPLVNRDFFFVPSGNVSSIFPIDWHVDDEFQYFNNLVTKSPESVPITLSFTGEIYDVRADSALYTAQYSISVPVLNSDPKIYQGSLKFTMTRDINSAWIIYFWEDIANQGFKSWSDLKIEFYL